LDASAPVRSISIPMRSAIFLTTAAVLSALFIGPACSRRSIKAAANGSTTLLPTGKRITPTAVPGSHFELLNPGLKDFPQFVAGQAMSTAVSPDGKTLLILTSGFNRINGKDGKPIANASEEYVFIYDISENQTHKKQALKVPNTFAGIAFSTSGKNFYVSGGTDDDLHTYVLGSDGKWNEEGSAIKLGHASGLGFFPGKEPLSAGGVAVMPDGKTALVANIYNDSVSIINLSQRKVERELDLRPGKIDAKQLGVPGGEYPFWISITPNNTAYVSCLRDREVVALQLGEDPKVVGRIKMAGNPNKMTLNRSGSRLFVAADNSDTVAIVDTRTNQVVEKVSTTAPLTLIGNVQAYKGSAPNDVALSRDEKTLFVTNGGSNSVAVIRLAQAGKPSEVLGLLPTGWYPNAVSVSRDDRMLYVVNGKTMPGPNPELEEPTKKKEGIKPGPDVILRRNSYILQLEKAGFLTIPVPDASTLARTTEIVARNNHFDARQDERDRNTMSALHARIKHVIYIIKENRTYDQILGDLGKGNGDPKLTMFGEKITPNFHRIARNFVDLDNFYDSGEVSGDGWPWSTSGRESDYGVKAVVLHYANRGTNYEYEGMNRDLNVGLATVKERQTANPKTPADPDLLPGAVNVAEPDGPTGAPRGKGYLWDAVLRAGLTFREYGCMSDMNFDAPREPWPFKTHVVLSRPSNPELYKFGDPYYKGFDPGYPDFYREAEWEREFDNYVGRGNLPSFEIIQLQEDHMGDFEKAISGVNTPETQQADNDYATARLIDRVAHSPYRENTLIFAIEDDSQDGPDHIEAHRTTAYVVGPYVKHNAVVSTYYTTVSMVRTIEDLLGIDHLNLNTATSRPMTDVFDLNQKDWSFYAKPSGVLARTTLPLSAADRATATSAGSAPFSRNVGYWARVTRGLDFSGEDRVDSDKFNRILWLAIRGTPYPITRTGTRFGDDDDDN
jgi:YVTN family beta-propeller protein